LGVPAPDTVITMAEQQSTTATAQRPLLRTVVGVVASDKGNKTIKVVVNYQTKHAKYGKYLKRRTVLHAHDEKNDAKLGDTVEIAECRPLSKTKHHRLVRIVERAPERAVQVSAEEVMTGKAPEER
jgi:small subunit ribosomal protein S17